MTKRQRAGGGAAWARVAAAFAAVAVLSGCDGAPAPGADAGPSFSGAPLVEVHSASGALHLAVWSDPQPPRAEVTPFLFRVTLHDANGEPQSGLHLTVTPWMPEMNHGPSVHPSVTPGAAGEYLVDTVDLMMGGAWELRTTFGDEEGADTAVPAFDVP